MTEKERIITDEDMRLLLGAVDYAQFDSVPMRDNLTRLMESLAHARIVGTKAVPPDVVTMNSQIDLKDLDSEEKISFTLVFPSAADYSRGKVSVLAPIGSAVIGRRAGDVVEWPVPSGKRRVAIETIHYQPEAAGDILVSEEEA